MKRLLPMLLLSLAGCGDDAKAIKRSLAECMMNQRAQVSPGVWDDGFLNLCMTAKGYRFDPGAGQVCSDIKYPAIFESCYRRSN